MQLKASSKKASADVNDANSDYVVVDLPNAQSAAPDNSHPSRVRTALERVYFYESIPGDAYYPKKGAGDVKSELLMYAIMPENVYDEEDWLKVHRKHADGAVEVACEPLPTRPDGFSIECNLLMICVLTTFIVACFLPLIYKTLLIAVTVVWLLCFACRSLRDRNTRDSRFDDLNTFLTSFSRIEHLVLENIVYSSRETDGTMPRIRKALDLMCVERLEIRDIELDTYLSKHIVGLCYEHGIRNVSLTVHKIQRGFDFDKFAQRLSEFAPGGVTLNVYEKSCIDDKYYFDKSRDNWDKMANKLRSRQISLSMETIHDDNFDMTYGFGVKSRLRVEKMGGTGQQSLQPMKKSRGFNYRD